MQVGWKRWTLPGKEVYVGRDNRLVTRWLNGGPGPKADNSCYETPSISFITLSSATRICNQFDMFEHLHQMKLCNELESAGLLSSELKEQWVMPTKEKISHQLTRSL